jgi:hypothetical protein
MLSTLDRGAGFSSSLTHPQLFPNVERREVAVADARHAAARLLPFGAQRREHEQQRKRAVDEQARVPFLLTRVLGIQVDGVGVVGQGAEVEECEAEIRVERRWSRVVSCLTTKKQRKLRAD